MRDPESFKADHERSAILVRNLVKETQLRASLQRHLDALIEEEGWMADYGPEFVFIGQWYVANESFSAVLDNADFRQQYEEVP